MNVCSTALSTATATGPAGSCIWRAIRDSIPCVLTAVFVPCSNGCICRLSIMPARRAETLGLKPFQTSQAEHCQAYSSLGSRCRSRPLSSFAADRNPGKRPSRLVRMAGHSRSFTGLSGNIANNLMAAGAEPGDRIAIHLLNGPELALAVAGV